MLTYIKIQCAEGTESTDLPKGMGEIFNKGDPETSQRISAKEELAES